MNDLPQWKATHAVVPKRGEPYEVFLDSSADGLDLSGPAYTREEWETASQADLELHGGWWRFQGRPFNGSVRAIGRER